jgi:hypothetical protein
MLNAQSENMIIGDKPIKNCGVDTKPLSMQIMH